MQGLAALRLGIPQAVPEPFLVERLVSAACTVPDVLSLWLTDEVWEGQRCEAWLVEVVAPPPPVNVVRTIHAALEASGAVGAQRERIRARTDKKSSIFSIHFFGEAEKSFVDEVAMPLWQRSA